MASSSSSSSSSSPHGANGPDCQNRARPPHIDLNENFIFVNRCFRDDSGPIETNINHVDPHNLDAHCASNIGVYPKPTRSSNPDHNVFNARCGPNEQTAVNGSLYY